MLPNGRRLCLPLIVHHHAGFNNYYVGTYDASPQCSSCTQDVATVFACAHLRDQSACMPAIRRLRPADYEHACNRNAQSLGLTVLRTWAFSDGAGQWNAIQPELGVLNQTILSQACHSLLRGMLRLK